MRFGIVGLIVLIIGAYVARWLSMRHGTAKPLLSLKPRVRATDRGDVECGRRCSRTRPWLANLAVSPGSALLDPVTHRLKEDLVLRVRSAAQPVGREYTRGMLPGIFPVPLTLAGHINVGPSIDTVRGPSRSNSCAADTRPPPELIPVIFIDHLSGFKVSATKVHRPRGRIRVSVRRALSTAVFGIVILRRAHRHRRPGPFRCGSDAA